LSAIYWAVVRSTITVGGLSLLVKLVAVIKEGFVAYRVGTAAELDAFLLAYAFPSFFLNVLAGSLATAFVPVYVRLRSTEGEQAASNFAATMSWRLAAGLVASAIVLAPISSGLIQLTARSFDDSTMSTVTVMVYALMPVLLLNGLTGYWSGFLNARHRFTAAAIVPLATPLSVAAALLVLWDAWGIYTMVAGTLVGGLIEAALLAVIALRSGLPLFADRKYKLKSSNGLFGQFLQAAGSNALIGATLLVDQAMAAMLAPGSVSALSFGTRVTAVVIGLGTMALATALLPQFSLLVAGSRFAELRALLKQFCSLTVVVTVPLTALLVGTSEWLVAVLFQRGSFSVSDAALVADVQSVYALQIPFFSLSMIAVRLISAMQANKLLVLCSALSLMGNVILNLVLSRYLGVVGIALATTIVYMGACIFLWAAAFITLSRIQAHR
jgi:putative peptidoglycan lipid II flippase